MCTVILSLQPRDRFPLRLLGIRDELITRPWRPPARHWPGQNLIGGIDELAGGTWLAVEPAAGRVACLLNGRGPLAPPEGRRSRGELPLRVAAEGPSVLQELARDPAQLAAYDPFHLICATADSVTTLSHPGGRPPADKDATAAREDPIPVVRELPPGPHMFTNAGHVYPADPDWADPAAEPKAAHFADKFAAARPPADPALPLAQAWGDWLTLAAGDGLDPADPAATLVRDEYPDGRMHGTTSITLIGLGPGGLRYDFQPTPGNTGTWYSVTVR